METTEKTEEFKINGEELLQKVKELIRAGNVRRIIVKNEKDESLIEIPLTMGAIGVLVAPVLAAIGATAALLTKCTLVVEKRVPADAEEKEGESQDVES